MKIGVDLKVVMKVHAQIHQLIDGFTLIWEKLFDCFSYISFPWHLTENQMKYIYIIIQ